MKTKFNKFLILASAGALTGLVWADDAQIRAGKADAEVELRSDFNADINEPAGSDRYHRSSRIHGRSDSTSQEFGETTTGLHRDRTPRQGLGSEDLTKNEQKIYNPGGYAASDSFIQSEASGAERSSMRENNREAWTKTNARQQHGKVRRASELIGMEVKNAQGERVGEIKDVVLDLQSGRVAYTVLSAAGYADMSDRLYAVPPAVYTRSTDERTLVLNTDKEMLKAAPSFEKNSWSESNNQQFTTEVYRYYKQPIYWQSSGAIREPSGSDLKNKRNGQRDESDKWERGNNLKEESRPEIKEPSGAEPSQPLSDTSSDLNQNEAAAPVAVEPERYQSPAPETDATLQPDQSSAANETEELKAPTQGAAAEANQDAAAEPAGAAIATTPAATSDDQAGGNTDRNMSERLRTEFKNDTDLSAKTENVKVSASNGRITLRGSVASEEEKKAIGMKAQTIAGSADKVDNQLRVTTEPSTP